jgi:hypothetical protein
VSLLFLSQARLRLLDTFPELTVSQVRQATSALITSWCVPSIDATVRQIEYYQRRNAQARESHRKTRVAELSEMGIDTELIRRCRWEDGWPFIHAQQHRKQIYFTICTPQMSIAGTLIKLAMGPGKNVGVFAQGGWLGADCP